MAASFLFKVTPPGREDLPATVNHLEDARAAARMRSICLV